MVLPQNLGRKVSANQLLNQSYDGTSNGGSYGAFGQKMSHVTVQGGQAHLGGLQTVGQGSVKGAAQARQGGPGLQFK